VASSLSFPSSLLRRFCSDQAGQPRGQARDGQIIKLAVVLGQQRGRLGGAGQPLDARREELAAAAAAWRKDNAGAMARTLEVIRAELAKL
jgi:hypothetical protein